MRSIKKIEQLFKQTDYRKENNIILKYKITSIVKNQKSSLNKSLKSFKKIVTLSGQSSNFLREDINLIISKSIQNKNRIKLL